MSQTEAIEAPPDQESHAPPPAVRWVWAWRWGRYALQFGVPLAIVLLVWHELHALDIHRVRQGLAQADASLVLWGVLAAFLGVCVMGLYDAIAFPRGHAGALGFPGRWTLGAVLFGWTNFIAMGPIGGPALRIIAYKRFGLSGPEITRGFVGHYSGASAGLLAWLIAAWLPAPAGAQGLIVRLTVAMLGAIGLAVLIGRLASKFVRRHRFGADLDRLPLARLGVVSFFDWGLTLVSFALLVRAAGVRIDPTPAARTMFTGHFAGLVSMIPGGLGSADAVWFKGFDLLGIAHNPAASAIVLFRVGFYMAPWVASLFVIYGVLLRRSERLRLWQRRVVAAAVMLNAGLFLLSAATPAVRPRLHALNKLVPLGAVEVSHLLATLSAVLMLFLVRGLLRGYRSAYLFTIMLLLASAAAHPLKGGDYEEAVASLVLLVLLLGVNGAFTRRGRVPVGWELVLAAGVGSLAFFLVVGLSAFERIPYRPELWTTFAERAEASRFLRASVLLAVVTLVFMLRQAMRPAHFWVTPTEADIDRAERFARQYASSADALLVGGGDKGVWFYEPEPGKLVGTALYQRRGDRLIVYKDPVVTSDAEAPHLINAMLRFADELDVELVFSMISSDWMSHLHDFGFHFLKVNEEAVVPLTGFSLQGGRNAGFRRLLRDMEKAGVTYEVLQPPLDDALIDTLRAVSDAWLADKGGRELQFSACYFSPAYLRRNPVGVARNASGDIIAFINILATRPGGPATLDLMRYLPRAADNLMDFVIIRTMQTLAEHEGGGYASFSLGGAPLSDVGVWRGSRLAERFLHVFSKKAERLYNYQGLLMYKTKFHPQWQPRYMAFQQPWDWASSLIANARLVQAHDHASRARIAAARVGQYPSA